MKKESLTKRKPEFSDSRVNGPNIGLSQSWLGVANRTELAAIARTVRIVMSSSLKNFFSRFFTAKNPSDNTHQGGRLFA